jgi:hypothetical protein
LPWPIYLYKRIDTHKYTNTREITFHFIFSRYVLLNVQCNKGVLIDIEWGVITVDEKLFSEGNNKRHMETNTDR